MWLNQSFQRRPRHHRSHLGQEYVPLCALLLACKVQRRKAQLTFHRRTSESIAPVCHLRTIDQSFLKANRVHCRLIVQPRFLVGSLLSARVAKPSGGHLLTVPATTRALAVRTVRNSHRTARGGTAPSQIGIFGTARNRRR